MIVRINQSDAVRAEQEAAWPPAGLQGPVRAPWPADARAFELLILGQDEQNRPLSEAFRQAQLRHMIPQAAAALREAGDEIVVRLDGPFADGELLGAVRWLTEPGGLGRYAVSPLQKWEHGPAEVLGSVRVQPSPRTLAGLCADPQVGLDRGVRMRLFAVPEDLVLPLLDAQSPDDDRWASILARCGFMIATPRGLRSLQVTTRRHDAAAVKARIMQRLMAVASGAAG